MSAPYNTNFLLKLLHFGDEKALEEIIHYSLAIVQLKTTYKRDLCEKKQRKVVETKKNKNCTMHCGWMASRMAEYLA